MAIVHFTRRKHVTRRKDCKCCRSSFYENNIRSACLATSMFCKFLIEKHLGKSPILKKGYVEMNDMYWGHFWLILDDKVLESWFIYIFSRFTKVCKNRLPKKKNC